MDDAFARLRRYASRPRIQHCLASLNNRLANRFRFQLNDRLNNFAGHFWQLLANAKIANRQQRYFMPGLFADVRRKQLNNRF